MALSSARPLWAGDQCVLLPIILGSPPAIFTSLFRLFSSLVEELVRTRRLPRSFGRVQTTPHWREREDSKSLHKLHLTTPINQSRSNSAQSLHVVAAHICVKTTAETDSLHLYVVDLPDDVEPELTICQQRKSCPFVLFSSHVDPSSKL